MPNRLSKKSLDAMTDIMELFTGTGGYMKLRSLILNLEADGSQSATEVLEILHRFHRMVQAVNKM